MESFFEKYIDAVKDTDTIKYTGAVTAVKGLMIESYIEDGAQKSGEHRYGCSITDPCLGWEKTARLVLELAEAL